MKSCNIVIESLTAGSLDANLVSLAIILNACVADGANVGFILPHTIDDSRAFWSERVLPAMSAGGRTILIARIDGNIVGTVQLDTDKPSNQPHRAEVSKLLVHPGARRKGVAKALMIALENEARVRRRTLLTLDTTNEFAEKLYLSLGYLRAGVIPAYARDPLADRYDDTILMYRTL